MEKEIAWLKANRQFLSLRAIEIHLGMTDATLRKFFVEGAQHRAIPVAYLEPLFKWVRSIAGNIKEDVEAPVKSAKIKKLKDVEKQSTVPPVPVKMIGEGSLEFAERKNLWKKKYGNKIIG